MAQTKQRKVLVCCLYFLITVSFSKAVNLELEESWNLFKSNFNKSFTGDEETKRRAIFEDNVAYVTLHNLEADMGMHSYRLGINSMAELTLKEFKEKMTGLKLEADVTQELKLTLAQEKVRTSISPMAFETNLDYRKLGMVTPVRNQGYCGCCYAFSACGALEGQWKKKTGKLTVLSPQNILDCSKANSGCDGGTMPKAFQYVKENRGIDTEASYPYMEVKSGCHFTRKHIGANCTGFVQIHAGDEMDLLQKVASVGPVSVGFNANRPEFQFYRSGVFDHSGCDPYNLNHAMLVVGYGKEAGIDYWLIKNSYGTDWGEEGYLRIIRGKYNQCGVASYASYPVV